MANASSCARLSPSCALTDTSTSAAARTSATSAIGPVQRTWASTPSRIAAARVSSTQRSASGLPRSTSPTKTRRPCRPGPSLARRSASTAGSRGRRFCGRGLATATSTKSLSPNPQVCRHREPAAIRPGVGSNSCRSMPFQAVRTGTGIFAARTSASTACAHAASRTASCGPKSASPFGQPGRVL